MRRLPVKLFRSKVFWIVLLAAALAAAGVRFLGQRRGTHSIITVPVKRQNLVISVRENGNLVALKSQTIVNEVQGQRTILEVVDEGTEISQADVEAGRVLIRLDTKDLVERIQQEEIQVENSRAAVTQAEQRLEIQKKENESAIRDAELKVRFSRMEVEKYLGKTLADAVLAQADRDYRALVRDPRLGGDGLNQKKNRETKVDLAKEELVRAEDRLTWSARLAEREYVTKTELEADRLSKQQREVALEQARLELDLFLTYDFPKTVEKLVSDYEESVASLDRVKTQCNARLIDAMSAVRSQRSILQQNERTLQRDRDNFEKCTIRATQPGFVVYATSSRPFRSGNPIQPGTSVWQFQSLLEIPDLSQMGVEAKIHEGSVERVTPGQRALVKIDAFPERVFEGTVQKVALMPDPQMKWLNPDVNVYVARIALDGTYDFLKPGMNAQVEIIIKTIPDTLVVPMAAVRSVAGTWQCEVLSGNKREVRTLQLGDNSQEYVEVRSGLREGELVVLSGSVGPSMTKKERAEKGSFKETSGTAGQRNGTGPRPVR